MQSFTRFLLTLAVLAVAACGEDPVRPTPEAEPVGLGLEIVSGAGQTGRVGAALEQPIVVRVVDEAGAPVADQPVQFEVWRGEGHFVAGTDVSDEDGLARAVWVLGTNAEYLQIARIHLVVAGSVLDTDTIDATALAGSLQDLAIDGDLDVTIERLDTLEIRITGLDEFGNVVDPDSFELTWTTSDAQVVAVDDGAAVGLSQGDAVVTATSGEATAALSVHVEGTRSTFHEMWGGLVAGGGRLVMTTGDSLYFRNDAGWTGMQTPSEIAFAAIGVAPEQGRLWAAGGGVHHSMDGLVWTPSLVFPVDEPAVSARIVFGPGDTPVLVHETHDNIDQHVVSVPHVSRLEGDTWVSLDMPRMIAGDTAVAEIFSAAVAPNGDVYVGGYVDDDLAASGSLPFLARWDGAGWHFLDLPWSTGLIGELETTSTGVVAVRKLGIYDWVVARVDGDVVQPIETPHDAGPFMLAGIAVSPEGRLSYTYYDVDHAKAGAAWQDAGEWRTWQDARIQSSPMGPAGPAWHQGALWFPMSVGFTPGNEEYFIVQLEPELP